MLTRRLILAFLVLTTGLTASARNVLATSLLDGFDLFVTQPGTFVQVGDTRLDLSGRPIGPGGSDTVVERLQGIPPGLPLPPPVLPFESPSGQGTVNIQIELLALRGNIGAAEVLVDLIPGFVQHLGTMTITHTSPDGGTFHAELPVDARATSAVLPGGFLDFHKEFISDGSWLHGESGVPGFPSGGFVVQGLLREFATDGTAEHVVSPVPEPTTLLLLGSTMTGLGLAARWRRRRQD